jgi:hypothetical protein
MQEVGPALKWLHELELLLCYQRHVVASGGGGGGVRDAAELRRAHQEARRLAALLRQEVCRAHAESAELRRRNGQLLRRLAERDGQRICDELGRRFFRFEVCSFGRPRSAATVTVGEAVAAAENSPPFFWPGARSSGQMVASSSFDTWRSQPGQRLDLCNSEVLLWMGYWVCAMKRHTLNGDNS